MEPNDKHIRKLTGPKNPEENFKMPDGYFDTFSSRVKEKIETRNQPQRSSIFSRLAKPVFSVPVAAIVLLTAYFAFFNNTPATNTGVAVNPPAQPVGIEEIPEEDIEVYLAQSVELIGVGDDVESDLLAYALEVDEDNQPIENVQPSPLKKDTLQEPSDEEIEDYLINTTDEQLFENL